MIEFSDSKSTCYTIQGGDEFNGNQIDRNKWMTAYPWARHLYCSLDASVYSDGDDLNPTDGILKISARKSPITTRAIPYEKDDFVITCNDKPASKNLMQFDYQSGMIYSIPQYTYGYFEIRFRSDSGNGLWPAFWLFGEENKEIDVFEIGGTKSKSYHVDIHCKDGCDNYNRFLGIIKSNWGGYIETDADWSTAFHTAGINWTSEGITWFIDGTPVAWWRGRFSNPMSIIANLAVTNKEGTFGGKADSSTPFPAVMEVDYIRVWKPAIPTQLKNSGETLINPSGRSIHSTATVTKKIRPEYNKKILKNTPDRLILELQNNKQLAVQFYTTNNNRVSIEVIDKKGRLIKSESIKSGNSVINLSSVPPGEHDLLIKNGSALARISVEMPM